MRSNRDDLIQKGILLPDSAACSPAAPAPASEAPGEIGRLSSGSPAHTQSERPVGGAPSPRSCCRLGGLDSVEIRSKKESE